MEEIVPAIERSKQYVRDMENNKPRNWEMAFNQSVRATPIADNPDYQNVIVRLSREDQIAYRNIFLNTPRERIPEELRRFEQVREEREREKGEICAAIAERIPEPSGYMDYVGFSEDSVALARMFSGIEYDSAAVQEIFLSNPELARKTAEFFTRDIE